MFPNGSQVIRVAKNGQSIDPNAPPEILTVRGATSVGIVFEKGESYPRHFKTVAKGPGVDATASGFIIEETGEVTIEEDFKLFSVHFSSVFRSHEKVWGSS